MSPVSPHIDYFKSNISKMSSFDVELEKFEINDSNLFSCSALPSACSPWIAVNGSLERRADETGTHNPQKSHAAPPFWLYQNPQAHLTEIICSRLSKQPRSASHRATSTSLSIYTDSPWTNTGWPVLKPSPTHSENPEWSLLWRASYSSPAPCLSCSSKVIKEDVWRHNTGWVVIKKSRG